MLILKNIFSEYIEVADHNFYFELYFNLFLFVYQIYYKYSEKRVHFLADCIYIACKTKKRLS